ncbi:hypothetical protein EDB84DRAFT_1519370 [Lactarius hengduanensis]|nr:hypothetical protein EDB84DRAFT_1519370 [Lactarius hengduanensis]
MDVNSRQTFSCFVFLDLISAIQNRGLGCSLTQNWMLVLTVATSLSGFHSRAVRSSFRWQFVPH